MVALTGSAKSDATAAMFASPLPFLSIFRRPPGSLVRSFLAGLYVGDVSVFVEMGPFRQSSKPPAPRLPRVAAAWTRRTAGDGHEGSAREGTNTGGLVLRAFHDPAGPDHRQRGAKRHPAGSRGGRLGVAVGGGRLRAVLCQAHAERRGPGRPLRAQAGLPLGPRGVRRVRRVRAGSRAHGVDRHESDEGRGGCAAADVPGDPESCLLRRKGARRRFGTLGRSLGVVAGGGTHPWRIPGERSWL